MNNEERLIAQLKAQYNAQPLPPMLEERICDSCLLYTSDAADEL